MPTPGGREEEQEKKRHTEIRDALLKIAAEIRGLKVEVETVRHALNEMAKAK